MNTNQPIALITGAGSGIGRGLAHRLALDGYAIAALDNRDDGLRTLAAEFQAKSLRFAWRIADVTEPPGLFSAIRELEAELGPTDVLIANAGVGLETSASNYNVADMNKVLNVNLLGVSNSIGAVLPGMIERRRGHVVAISSVASYRGLPRMLAYSASKAGVNAIMDGLRIEMKPYGIHGTTVCPGWVRTPMTAALAGALDDMIGVDEAVEEIAKAIRKKWIFYTFPRPMRWRMKFLTSLPLAWQDGLIAKQMHRIRVKK